MAIKAILGTEQWQAAPMLGEVDPSSCDWTPLTWLSESKTGWWMDLRNPVTMYLALDGSAGMETNPKGSPIPCQPAQPGRETPRWAGRMPRAYSHPS